MNNKNYIHPYPHLKYNRDEVEKTYLDGLNQFNSWGKDERIRRGFGENGHAHPRRFYIFLQKYFVEIKYFMDEKERTQYVFPWVVATRSERINALKKHKVYFDIKQTTLRLAKNRYTIYKQEQELKKLK